jgi:eukaryotic-like serine/threonine-protein kinase
MPAPSSPSGAAASPPPPTMEALPQIDYALFDDAPSGPPPVAVPASTLFGFGSNTAPASPATAPVSEASPAAIIDHLESDHRSPGDDDRGDVADPPDEPLDTGYDPNFEYKPPRRRLRLVLIALVVLAALGGGAFFVYGLLKDETYAVPDIAGMTQAVAENQIAKNDWKLVVTTERSDAVPVGQVIRTDPPAGAKLAKGASITFVVSDGPPLATLPDVTGQTLAAATANLEGAKLAITVADMVFDENIAADTVISWSVPAQPGLVAGAQVMPNTVVVSVVVSKGPAPRSVPNLLGLDLATATATLADVQLLIVQDPNDQFSPDYPAGVIAVQSVQEGTPIERGETITVALSKGPDLVLMPSLGGLTYDQIVAALTNAGLTVGNITGDKVTQTISDATVDGVSVVPDQQFPRGTAIDLIFM